MMGFLFLFLILFLFFGCSMYVPPKYVCRCEVICSQTLIYPTLGGETKDEVINKCSEYASKNCPDENFSFDCKVMSWDEWNRFIEKERGKRDGEG
ncbi:MAG: hypothetical protein QXI58_02750 [Candidatus Micrarchaeia archaeon]